MEIYSSILNKMGSKLFLWSIFLPIGSQALILILVGVTGFCYESKTHWDYARNLKFFTKVQTQMKFQKIYFTVGGTPKLY